jgi:hypothetical protein
MDRTRLFGNSLAGWVAGAIVLASQMAPGIANAGTLIGWDWNDGTTQGWEASFGTTNVSNQLLGVNSGNGSLQLFSPDISSVSLTNLGEITFDLTFLSYSTVASPSQLEGFLSICPLNPGPCLQWNLDFANLAFNQSRTFTLSIHDVTGGGSLSNAGFFSFLFAEPGFGSNTSSALLDNFVVSRATTPVPEPSSLILLVVGALAVFAKIGIRRRLPRLQESSFKTAQALGRPIPPSVLGRADEVIQ